jgi:hypothetical protein
MAAHQIFVLHVALKGPRPVQKSQTFNFNCCVMFAYKRADGVCKTAACVFFFVQLNSDRLSYICIFAFDESFIHLSAIQTAPTARID